MNPLPMVIFILLYVAIPLAFWRIMRWRGNDDEPKNRLERFERLVFVWITSVAVCCWCWLKRKITVDNGR